MDDLSKENEPKFDKISNKDASFEKTLNTNLTDDSYIEEEIFFGPISSKEEKLIEKWKNRKTEYYSPSRFQNLDLNTEKRMEESKSSMEQDSDIIKSQNTCDVQNFNCQLSKSEMTNADEHLVRITNLELSDCEDIHMKSDTKHDAFVEYYCDKIIEDLDNNLKCTQNYKTSLNSTCGEENLKDSKLFRSGNQNLSEDNEMVTNDYREHINSKYNNSTSENDFKDNEEVDHLTNDLERSLVLTKSFSNSEPNDLNKLDNCTLKRESYFTSLQIINVSDKTFDNFTLDNLETNTSGKVCNDTAIKNTENDDVANTIISGKFSFDSLEQNSSICNSQTPSSDATENSLATQPSQEYTVNNTAIKNTENDDVANTIISENFSFDSLEQNSSICNSQTPSSDTTGNSLATQPSQEYTVNTDYANNGLLRSHSLSLKSSNNESFDCDIHHDGELSHDVSLQEKSENYSQTPDYPDTPPSFSPPSPDNEFNDTIEEMERLLAHGINYYKDPELPEESIHQAKEQTISSSSSVHSFNPNFDSTRASSDNLKKDAAKNEPDPVPLMEKELIKEEINSKKSVPVKPPRIEISQPTPKSECKKLPIYSNYKQRKDDTPSHINSPLVKTVTKSKIESFTPATNRKDINRDIYSNTPKNINTAYYNTPKSRGITAIVGSSCPSKLVNTPTSTKFTPQNLALKSSYNKAGLSKIPRLPSQFNLRSRHRTLNIESPVANYLQNNPPPPLVTTVKPRYKVSPLKLQSETAPENFRKTPLKESNMHSKSEMIASRLPQSVHKQGEGFLVNKENILTKRKVPGDRPPVIVLKHKGRMKLPKDTILKNEKDSPCLMTNNKTEEIINTEKIGERETGRESLMEISIYEQHLVRHANTLK
ncbi:hypothetical protein Avbf_01832 [Armadillidium vulgare]|nr:hypothetical protein Avbf_01832 [Armadillidium vulgare]